jgi:hypothetical protein
LPFAPTIIVINDFEEEEQVEKRVVNQLVEVEQLVDFSLESIQGRFFDIKLDSRDIFVVMPTKAQSKCMMRRKGKEMMEEGG